MRLLSARLGLELERVACFSQKERKENVFIAFAVIFPATQGNACVLERNKRSQSIDLLLSLNLEQTDYSFVINLSVFQAPREGKVEFSIFQL